LTLASEHWRGQEHHFAVWDVDHLALADELGRVIRDLYAETAALRESLLSAADGIGEIIDRAAVESIIDEVVDATVPEPRRPAQNAWLELTRNEAGEVLAYHTAQARYGVFIVSRLRHKEVSQQPTRGMDLLGIGGTGNDVFLLAGEVKSSSSSASPPPVVGSGHDSMRGQLTRLSRNRQKILEELNWSHKHGNAADRNRIATALILCSLDKLKIRLFPVLVRPVDRHSANDFGCFLSESEDFFPHHIRFCLLRLTCTLEEFASLIYGKARSHAS
jgi:hypothetical protein